MTQGYTPELYQIEKVLGLRLVDGTKPLTHLRPIHLKVAYLHAIGMKGTEIAAQLSCKLGNIYKVLRDPLIRDIISRHMEDIETEIGSMAALAATTFRNGFNADSMAMQLRTLDIWMKGQGKYIEQKGHGETAEDVIARALGIVDKAVDMIKPLPGERARLIDVKPTGTEMVTTK